MFLILITSNLHSIQEELPRSENGKSTPHATEMRKGE